MCGEWQPTQLFTVDLYVVDMYEKERRAMHVIRWSTKSTCNVIAKKSPESKCIKKKQDSS